LLLILKGFAHLRDDNIYLCGFQINLGRVPEVPWYGVGTLLYAMNNKNANKLMKESLSEDIKNVFPECKSREHRLIWASIGLLFLGQLFSFVYVHNIHDPLLSKSNAKFMVNFDDEESNLSSSAESSTRKNPLADGFALRDTLVPIHERRKRSSDPKPNRKRSPKVKHRVAF
jgi:hypothetical protein